MLFYKISFTVYNILDKTLFIRASILYRFALITKYKYLLSNSLEKIIIIIIILCLTSDSDPCWAHADYSLYICREKTLLEKNPVICLPAFRTRLLSACL